MKDNAIEELNLCHFLLQIRAPLYLSKHLEEIVEVMFMAILMILGKHWRPVLRIPIALVLKKTIALSKIYEHNH